MNWIKRIFNWKKAPKATNEMKPIEMGKYYLNENIADEFFTPSFNLDHTVITEFDLERYIRSCYKKVKNSWKRSPKHYNVWLSNEYEFKLLKYNVDLNKISNNMKSYIGNLYTLYQQYYGKENKD